ncbi:MAG: M56 family metallopeptidase, partial [Anaerolineae bacterium]
LRNQLAGNGAFYALLALAGACSLVLGVLVAGLAPLYVHEIMNICRRSWAMLEAHLPAVGAVIPLLGLVLMFGRGSVTLIRQLKDTRRFLTSLPVGEDPPPTRLGGLTSELGITDHVDLIPDMRAYSFCYGLLHPRICVTTGLLDLLDDAELRALLLHERHHRRQRDPLRILLSEVATDAMSLLPIARALAQRHRVAQEVAADQAAIAGSDSDVPLSSALLKLLTVRSGRLQIPTAVGAFSVTEERIARLVYGEGVLGERLAGAWVATGLIIAGTLLMGYAGVAGMHALSAFPVECANTVALLQ